MSGSTGKSSTTDARAAGVQRLQAAVAARKQERARAAASNATGGGKAKAGRSARFPRKGTGA